jgi:hypothetical protein
MIFHQEHKIFIINEQNGDWAYHTQSCLLQFRQKLLLFIPVSMTEATPHVLRSFVFHSRPLSVFLFIIIPTILQKIRINCVQIVST